MHLFVQSRTHVEDDRGTSPQILRKAHDTKATTHACKARHAPRLPTARVGAKFPVLRRSHHVRDVFCVYCDREKEGREPEGVVNEKARVALVETSFLSCFAPTGL